LARIVGGEEKGERAQLLRCAPDPRCDVLPAAYESKAPSMPCARRTPLVQKRRRLRKASLV